jgi:hypothetical protein
MTSRHALLPAVTAAVVLVLAIVLPFAGCGLPLQGLSSEVDAGTPCNADGQCVDTNPCTADSCVAGACSHVTQPDGPAPSASQTAFDCMVVQCVKGQPDVQNDDLDIQADSEDCTVDQCNGGEAFHTAKPDGTGCKMGGDGVCKGAKCQILCKDDSKCNDDNPCTEDTCDLSTSLCAFAPLNGVNTPGASQIDHDCNIQVCVDGVDKKSPDDSDLPVTATDCDQELCTNGVASNPPLDLDVTCGPASDMRCDGAGSCVQCNSPTQCMGVDNDCQARSCTGHVCGISFKAAGTPRAAPFQTIGDCKDIVCDGAGNPAAQPQANDGDLPDDGNKCTMDICTAGVISHPYEAANTVCGNNSACNATGQCGCANDLACAAPTTCGGGGTTFVCGCTPKTCAVLGKTCGTVPDGCFSNLNCDNGTKEGTETDVDCGGGGAACGDTCAQGKVCTADADCANGHCADGVCCNTACNGTCQACSAAKKGSGADGVCGSIDLGLQDTSATMTCIGVKVCDGANGCKKIDGQGCGGNNECVSGSCADGVCCNTACNGTCLACSSAKKGGGPDGVCGNIAINQPDTAATATCTGASACDGAGNCKKSAGQTCATNGVCANGNCIDGVCCGVAGCPACQSCAAGAGLACGNSPAGQDNAMPNTCNGTSSCDGMGNCKAVNGQVCASGVNCVSGFCADGVCCSAACTGTCLACSAAKTGAADGMCTNVLVNQTDTVATTACNAPSACDGMGACKATNGQACPGGNNACLSGFCADGVCCNAACTGTCLACSAAKTGAADGMCTNVLVNQTDTVATTACNAPSACDGMGACKSTNGQACPGGNANCLSGFCTDGVCCGSVSCPACQSCALGANGTCANVPAGPDTTSPNTCMGNSTCDAAGACKSIDGQACTLPTTCLSGNCTDSVCCESTCTAQCKSCNVPNFEGTCTDIPINMIDSNASMTCNFANACDGAGNCKTASGSPCLTNGQCISGVCVPGVPPVCQ